MQSGKDEKKPTVSVLILTYNHAPFIAQAIDSVLSQNTEYRIDIIILEDCSTDGTQDIVREYAQRYPDRIRAILHEKNVGKRRGIQTVVYEGFSLLEGDYIAVLEGDDYWSDPQKLQRQISYLESHPDFVACSHNTIKTYTDEKTEPHRFLYWPGIHETHSIHDFVAMTSFFHISTLLFRNMRRQTQHKSFRHISNKWCCDIYFNMVHIQFGKLHYMDKDMAVYRCHKGGNFSNMPELQGRMFNINGHRRFNRWLGYRYMKGFAFAIYRLCWSMINDSRTGALPPLTFAQHCKYFWLEWLYGRIYDVLDRHPRLDPAVFWYKEAPKTSKPRQTEILHFIPKPKPAPAHLDSTAQKA